MALLVGQGHGFGGRHMALTAEIVKNGEDSVNPAGMKPGLDVYCGYKAGAPGYQRGGFSNMPAIKARFPGKLYLCVGTDCIDIEPGLATASQAPAFQKAWRKDNTNKPVYYASLSAMPAVKSALTGAGIARSDYYLWVAVWNHGSIPAGYDAIQNGNAPGFDSDLFEDYMWSTVTPPPPGPVPTPVPVPVPSGNLVVATKVLREVELSWAKPSFTVDHYVIACSPASPSGVIRPNGKATGWKVTVVGAGNVNITVSAIDTHGKVRETGTVHI
jgi:hypothetical protein